MAKKSWQEDRPGDYESDEVHSLPIKEFRNQYGLPFRDFVGGKNFIPNGSGDFRIDNSPKRIVEDPESTARFKSLEGKIVRFILFEGSVDTALVFDPETEKPLFGFGVRNGNEESAEQFYFMDKTDCTTLLEEGQGSYDGYARIKLDLKEHPIKK